MRKMPVVFALLFVSIVSAVSVSGQNMFRKINDFDGDLKADYVVTRNENGLKVWYVWQSTAGFRVFQWGLDSDKEAAGDYDGDGKTDFAVLRQAQEINNLRGASMFVYKSSTNTFYYENGDFMGNVETVEPYQQDYDGDGKAEYGQFFKFVGGGGKAVFYESSNSINRRTYSVDNNKTVLRLGDLTGDGTSEIIRLDHGNNVLNILNYPCCHLGNFQFGISGDQFVAGDFDGDGKGDITVFRESDGTWWWIRSSDGGILVAKWGISGDTPVPADYDGDGITDIAIWRDGNYWISGSQNGVSVFNWGLTGDKPVRY